MKNKIEFKRMLRWSGLIILLGITGLVFVSWWHDQLIKQAVNQQMASLLANVVEKYPQVAKSDLMNILNQPPNSQGLASLRQYGIDLQDDSVIVGWQQQSWQFLLGTIGVVAIMAALLIANFWHYQQRRNRDLQAITADIRAINQHEYRLDLADYTEDELAILKNELHKTTLVLREAADNSRHDKIQLQTSLSDISHQLKTPLTSIGIMLDNINDNPTMPTPLRHDFLQRIKHETTNLNFLVETLLKLSKFDAATIQFRPQLTSLNVIATQACEQVSALADLQGVTLSNQVTDTTLNCDPKWQTEAVVNIVKNCIEHSPAATTITLSSTSNQIYQSLIITDHGSGIAAVDLPHIFERFYKGQHAATNSVGIGLALAKTIVEHDHGDVLVRSHEGQGSRFELRYLR